MKLLEVFLKAKNTKTEGRLFFLPWSFPHFLSSSLFFSFFNFFIPSPSDLQHSNAHWNVKTVMGWKLGPSADSSIFHIVVNMCATINYSLVQLFVAIIQWFIKSLFQNKIWSVQATQITNIFRDVGWKNPSPFIFLKIDFWKHHLHLPAFRVAFSSKPPPCPRKQIL